MERKTVLIFPPTTEIANSVYRALNGQKHFDLLGASSIPSDRTDIVVPMLTNENEKEVCKAIGGIIKKYKIDGIIPCHDAIAKFISKCYPDQLWGSPEQTQIICRDKKLTAEVLKDVVNVMTNDYHLTIGLDQNTGEFKKPVYVKPNIGQGSQGNWVARRPEQVAGLSNLLFLFQPVLDGEEFTIDCFTNLNGVVCKTKARQSISRFKGITNHTISSDNEAYNSLFREWARKINKTLELRGFWFFQVKFKKDEPLPYLLEVGPRFSGGVDFWLAGNINFPLWHCYLFAEGYIDLFSFGEVYTDNGSFESYKRLEPIPHLTYIFDPKKHSTVYVDWDDTLWSTTKQFNWELFSVLGSMKEKGARITIMSKTESKKIIEVLREFRIEHFFENFIQTTKPKFEYLKSKDAILIDDSCKERGQRQMSFDPFNMQRLKAFIR